MIGESVFVVTTHYHYETTDIDGVFANQEDAEAMIEELKKTRSSSSITVSFEEWSIQ